MVAQNQSSYYRVPYPTTNKGRYENGYKFNGKELDDATQLYYYGARYYDPRISIFVSVDPLAKKTMKPYLYIGNNPINFIDPDGRIPYPITIRSFALFKTFGGSISRRQQSLSTSASASARVHLRINFDTDKESTKTVTLKAFIKMMAVMKSTV